MKSFTSYAELEKLCEAMVLDFFRQKGYRNVLCVDVEAFVWEPLWSMNPLRRRTGGRSASSLTESGL